MGPIVGSTGLLDDDDAAATAADLQAGYVCVCVCGLGSSWWAGG